MADKDISLQAFETVRTWTSLIVTLSTGTIVFTATFRRDLAPPGEALNTTWALSGAWIALGAAAVLGVFVFGALAARLNESDPDKLDVYKFPVWFVAIVQLLSFLVGIALFAFFAYQNLA